MKKSRISLVAVIAFFVVLSAVHFGKLNAMAYETKEIQMELFEERDFKSLSGNIEWISDDDYIVSTENGFLYAECPGKTTVIAFSKDTRKTLYKYRITVNYPKCKLEGKDIKLKIGDRKDIIFYTKEDNYTLDEFKDIDDYDDGIQRLSSDEFVAYVDKNGVIHADEEGTAYITIRIQKRKYKFKVTVRKKNPSFSKIYKEMKAFVKRNTKNYKCGKRNGRAILVCGGQYNWELNKGKIYLKHYEINPYIELTKKNGKTILKFKYGIEYRYNSPNYYSLNPKSFYIYSDNGKLKTDEFDYENRSHELFEGSIYMNILKTDAVVLSTEHSQYKIAKRTWELDNIFCGKNIGSKLTLLLDESGVHAEFLNKRKNYYYKLYKFYKKLLKMYM